MPSERFLKLAPEKKERILTAGYREFSRAPVEAASINSIIKEAEISRGSFYTYFEDKTDLLSYILSDLMQGFGKTVREFLGQCRGDLFACTEPLYERCLRELKNNGKMMFLKNVFTDPVVQAKLLGPENGSGGRLYEQMRGFCGLLLPEVDRERYALDSEQIEHLIPMIIMMTLRTAAQAAKDPENEEAFRHGMAVELQLLQYGALRRGDQNC